MFCVLFCCLFVAGTSGQPPASRLAVIRKAPEFTLTNQDGKAAKLADCKGKVLLVSFIFTTCNGSCPATTHRLAKIREQITAQPVLLLSITLDPERDTPEALRKYIKLYDLAADPKGSVCDWTFLTGPPANVNKTIEAWGMWVKPTANGQLDHPSRVFLVDQQQRIREVYNVDMLRPQEVLQDIELLVREMKK
jgi:protein SCO1/2